MRGRSVAERPSENVRDAAARAVQHGAGDSLDARASSGLGQRYSSGPASLAQRRANPAPQDSAGNTLSRSAPPSPQGFRPRVRRCDRSPRAVGVRARDTRHRYVRSFDHPLRRQGSNPQDSGDQGESHIRSESNGRRTRREENLLASHFPFGPRGSTVSGAQR